MPVTIKSRGSAPYFSQLTAAKLPEVGDPPPSIQLLSEILSLEPADILADDLIEPEAVSCGIPFLFIPVKTPEVLGRIKVDVRKWEETLKSYWAPEMFVFSAETWPGIFEGGHIRARMFAPALGIGEDPATGSACAALAGFLGFRSEQRDGTLKWSVDQGVEMGRPSRLELEVDLEKGSSESDPRRRLVGAGKHRSAPSAGMNRGRSHKKVWPALGSHLFLETTDTAEK